MANHDWDYNQDIVQDGYNNQSLEKKKLAQRITDRYRASFMHKESLGMHKDWAKYEDYWAGDVNNPTSATDPGSEVNIIQPLIESQVADLVNGEAEILVRGTGPSDQPFAGDVKSALDWVWRKNGMTEKLDEGERMRTKFGDVGWKVYYDFDALDGIGLVKVDPYASSTLFPDPKIKDVRRLQEGDFFIHVLPYTRRQLVVDFGEIAESVRPEGNFTGYDPAIFGEDDFDSAEEVINDQVKLFEYWEKDKKNNLRRVYMAGDIILKDSFEPDEDDEEELSPSFYEHGKYPFVIIPCYKKQGRLWGISDIKNLVPIQDMINDFDDQIRMNARLMGNIQIVVGLAAGINLKKWTNLPGLKIKAKDPTAWKAVEPTQMPAYIMGRREAGFKEAEVVSGRADVLEGRRAGSLRAASAIVALQEAGSRRANHKKLMLQVGFVEVLDMVVEMMEEFMTEEVIIDITEKDTITYNFFNAAQLNEIPYLTRNENFDGLSKRPGTEQFKPLLEPETDDEGNVMYNDEMGSEPRMTEVTKRAHFDLAISFGAGMPSNKAFIYQASLELKREGIITAEEARKAIKDMLSWPIIDPYNPEGEYDGRNVSNGANGQPGQPEQPGQPGQEQFPPSVGGQPGQGGEEEMIQQLMQIIDSLPPEIVQQIFASQGQGMPQQGQPQMGGLL